MHVRHLHRARELLQDPELMYRFVGAQKLKKFLASEAIRKAKEAVQATEKELLSWLVSNGWVVLGELQGFVLTCDVMKEALRNLKALNPTLGVLLSGNREVLKQRLVTLRKRIQCVQVEDIDIDDLDESDGDPFGGSDSD